MFPSVPGPLQFRQESAWRDKAGRGTDEEPALPAHGLQLRRWDLTGDDGKVKSIIIPVVGYIIYIYIIIYSIYILHIYNVCIIVCMYIYIHIYIYIYAHTLQWSYPVVWNNDEVNMLWYAARHFVDTGHSYRVHFSIFAVICLIMYILQQQLPKYLLTTSIWSYIYIHQTLSSSCYQCFTYPWNYFNICL